MNVNSCIKKSITNRCNASIKKILFIGLCLVYFYTNISYGQVLDADRTKPDSSAKKLNCVIGITGSIDKQKKNLVDGATSVDLSNNIFNNHIIIFKGTFDFTTNGNEFLQNSGYLHLRFRDNDTRLLSPEYFIQYQWNGLLGMKGRKLVGTNLRWMVLDRTYKNDLFLGLGVMYEDEGWNYKGVNSITDYSLYNDTTVQKIRINQYIKCAFSIGNNIDFVLSNFIQSDIKNIFKPRISTNVAINFQLHKHFGLSINSESMYDLNPVVPIDKFIYSTKLQLNIKF
jgi:hypothetical protein